MIHFAVLVAAVALGIALAPYALQALTIVYRVALFIVEVILIAALFDFSDNGILAAILIVSAFWCLMSWNYHYTVNRLHAQYGPQWQAHCASQHRGVTGLFAAKRRGL